MDSFWSKLLILGIVAAIGLFFIANVYGPQRSAQEAMAESTQQSVNAVKMGVNDMAQAIVTSDSVVSAVSSYCSVGNTISIIVVKTTGTHTFITSRRSDTNQDISDVVDIHKNYVRLNGTSRITFTEQL